VDRLVVKRKRSKTLVFTMLPALFFIGFMGWLMYALTPQRHAPKKPPRQSASRMDDRISFLPAIYEDRQEIAA
jgi:hypothetical protein